MIELEEPTIGGTAPPQQMDITPEMIMHQVPWKEAESVVILVNMGQGKVNQLYSSTMSWEQLSWMSKQLDAHITCHIGVMKEGF